MFKDLQGTGWRNETSDTHDSQCTPPLHKYYRKMCQPMDNALMHCILKKDTVDIASSIVPLVYVTIKWDYVAKAQGDMRGRKEKERHLR